MHPSPWRTIFVVDFLPRRWLEVLVVDVRVPSSLPLAPFGSPGLVPPLVLPAPWRMLLHVRLDFLRVPRAALRLEPEHRGPPRSTLIPRAPLEVLGALLCCLPLTLPTAFRSFIILIFDVLPFPTCQFLAAISASCNSCEYPLSLPDFDNSDTKPLQSNKIVTI